MANELNEAPTSATVKVKSPTGFVWLFTMRDEKASDLVGKMEKMEEAFMNRNWEPVVERVAQFGGAKAQTTGEVKKCETHNAEMKEKISKKTNKPYFSHSRKDIAGEWETCFGRGFDSERKDPEWINN